MVSVGPLNAKVQLIGHDHHVMGPGKADLLAAIEQAGSLSAAGRSLGMSYRKCWRLVDGMNKAWAGPLVQLNRKGGAGAGARLTDLGREVLTEFRAIEKHVATADPVHEHMSRLAERLGPPRTPE